MDVVPEPAAPLTSSAGSAAEVVAQGPFTSDPAFAPLLDRFIARVETQVQEIGRHLAASNAEEIRRITHQFKGVASNYGFAVLGSRAAEIEGRLRAGGDLGEVRSQIDDLVSLMRRITAAYSQRNAKP